MKGTVIPNQFPKDIVSSVIINNHKNLSYEKGIMLATRTYARFENGKTKVEIVRVSDDKLYIIGQGGEFECFTEIVIEYAEKVQKYLHDNYLRFKREMSSITVAYSKETEMGVSINSVRQSIIEKIQKGFNVKKN
jgi:hypothetical protein